MSVVVCLSANISASQGAKPPKCGGVHGGSGLGQKAAVESSRPRAAVAAGCAMRFLVVDDVASNRKVRQASQCIDLYVWWPQHSIAHNIEQYCIAHSLARAFYQVRAELGDAHHDQELSPACKQLRVTHSRSCRFLTCCLHAQNCGYSE